MGAGDIFSKSLITFEIDGKTYSEDLKKTSSWALWSAPSFNDASDQDSWMSKDSVGVLDVFKTVPNSSAMLKDEYIFVGLNPAEHIPNPDECDKCRCKENCSIKDEIKSSKDVPDWYSFHSGCVKKAQDYKLRYAFYETEYWGSFITDLFDIEATTKSLFDQKLKQRINEDKNYIKNRIKRLCIIRNSINPNAKIVAIGARTYDYINRFDEELITPLLLIPHFSRYVNIDWYKNEVLIYLGKRGVFDIEDVRKVLKETQLDDSCVDKKLKAMCKFMKQ